MSKDTRRSEITLSGKILIMNIFLVCFTILFSLGISLSYSMDLLEESKGDNLRNFSKTLASTAVVIDALENKENTPELNIYLDAIVESDNSIDVVTVADMTGKRYYHIDKEKIGEYIVGGDEQRAINGEAYMSDAVGTQGLQRRYFYPVYNSRSEQVGFVLTSTLMSNLKILRSKVLIMYFRSALIVLLVGLLTCAFLTVSIKRSLLGYEPSRIAQIFMQRGEIMDALEEGLIAADKHGEIILVNKGAELMLGVDGAVILGKRIDDTSLHPKLKQALHNAKEESEKNLTMGEENILYDSIPILEGGKEIGAVAILRNRTEATRLAEQLTGVNHFIEALRSNTHEFMNKLHVILGLLQMDGVEEAKKYIVDISQEQNETISAVTRTIQNRTLAALILGKITHSKELGISTRLSPDSAVPRHGRYLSTNSLVTIVGNLLENAIEAVDKKEQGGDKEIILSLHEDNNCLMISVDDTGIGLTPQELELLKQGLYSTKSEHRGCGMRLIRGIVENSEGELCIDSEKWVGSSFTVIIKKPRAG